MPLDSKSKSGGSSAKAKAEPVEEQAPQYETPSQYALDKVGPAPDSDDPEELLAHGERYLAEKLKRRHGHE